MFLCAREKSVGDTAWRQEKRRGRPTQRKEGWPMAYRESDRSIVLRGRESRLHELILNGEGIDSGMKLSTGTINRTVGSEK